jgi:hypothetical protein
MEELIRNDISLTAAPWTFHPSKNSRRRDEEQNKKRNSNQPNNPFDSIPPFKQYFFLPQLPCTVGNPSANRRVYLAKVVNYSISSD